MALTIRLSEVQTDILQEIVDKTGTVTKSKAIIWMIENIQRIEKTKMEIFNDLVATKKELAILKNALKAKKEAVKDFQEIINSL
jgi:hypothetical protein